MTLENELKAVLHVIPRLFRELWESEYNIIRNYWKIFIALLVIFILLVGSYFGYRWYVVSREQRIQGRLALHMQDYQHALQADSKDELMRLESLFDAEYARDKGGSIAPLFMVLRANAQIKQEKYTEAVDSLQTAINALPEKSPLTILLKTKCALLQLDNQDETMQQLGLQELIQLAREPKNDLSDVALFYLGRYYWAHDKLDDAKRAWQELIDTPEYVQPYASPWAQEAYEIVKQVSE